MLLESEDQDEWGRNEVVRWAAGGGLEVLNPDLDPARFSYGSGGWHWVSAPDFAGAALDIADDGTICGHSTTTYIQRFWDYDDEIDEWVLTDEIELVLPCEHGVPAFHDHWPSRWASDGTVHLDAPPDGDDVPRPIGWTGSTDEDVLDAPNWYGSAWHINAHGRMAGIVTLDSDYSARGSALEY